MMQIRVRKPVKSTAILRVLGHSGNAVVKTTEKEDLTVVSTDHPTSCDLVKLPGREKEAVG